MMGRADSRWLLERDRAIREQTLDQPLRGHSDQQRDKKIADLEMRLIRMDYMLRALCQKHGLELPEE